MTRDAVREEEARAAAVRGAGARTCDVLVVGGGPGGSTAATLFARAGCSVVLLEREMFPRFHVGESLLPANIPLLKRLGVLEAVEAEGFQVKHGATFYDQASDHSHTFYFLKDRPIPSYTYQVPRARFDAVLLDHARKSGADVLVGATASDPRFDADGVSVTVTQEGDVGTIRARFLVDASGRDGFLTSSIITRERVPNLGKVALFAHFRGAARAPGIDEGNIRIFVFDEGWFWWIPFAGDVTSVGAVLHARTVRARDASVEALYDEMIAKVPRIAAGLARATRISPVRRAANFAYLNRPIVGDRYVCVGDAVAFIDPIFSAGVYIAMQSAELAAAHVLPMLRDDRFARRRLHGYERQVERGVRPLFKFIHRYYEPTFLEIFLRPRAYFGILDAVLAVLSGAAFLGMPWRMRASLQLFFTFARINYWVRRSQGRPVESRLEW